MAHTIDEIRKLRNGRGTSAASSSDSKTRSTGHSVDEIRRLGGRNVYEDSEGYKPTNRADLNVSAPSKPTSDAYRYGTPSGNATLDQLNTMMSNFNKIQSVLSTPKNMPEFKSDSEIKDYYESIPDYNVFERIGDSEKTEKYNQKQALSSKYNEIKKANDLATLNAYGITEDELKKAQTYLQGARGGIFNKKYMNERTSKEEMQKIYDKFDRVREETGINPYELQFDYQTEIDEELANEHPISSTISTYAANPVESTLNTGKKVINYATGKPIENDYSYTNNIRNTVSQNIDSEIGRQAYGIGNSIADMGVALLASRLTGSRMLGPGLQGFEKADAVMNESVNRGLNPTQVMMEGIASGITTAATESIPMGKWEEIAEKKLIGLGKDAIKKNVVKKLLAGMASEGLQEMSEDVADLLVDRLIAGDKSEIDTNIRTLMEMNPGMTKEEAEAQAWKDWCVQVVLDGVGGAISGGVMSGLSIGVGLANPYATGYINREALSEQIKKMDPESEVYKTYQDLAQKRGETLSSASDDEVSDLFQKAYAEASKADRTAYDKVISDKLKEAGYTDEQVKATLEALTAKNPTKRQKFLIDNELVRDAVNEADNTEGLKMVQKVAENVEAIDKTIKSAQEVKEEKRIAEAESKINTDTESSVRGDKVEIYGMDIKGGVYVVNTSKGSFPVEDVKIASDIQDAVTHSVNISDDNLKEAFVKNYHGQDISAYEAYAYRAFTAGKSFNQNLIDENTIDFLGSEAVHEFLDAGRLSVRKQTKESEERAIQAASEAKGKFKQGTFTNNVDYSKLDSTRKKIFNFLKGMSNIGGLHINVINDINDQNGMFQYDPNGGTITVNLAAGATDANGNNTQMASYIIPTLSHEMTHYLEANAPSAYNALEKAVLKALRAEGFDIDAEVSKKIDAYKKATNGKVVLTESEALDEIIAQSCEGMMSNEETMEKTLSFMNLKEVKTFKKALEKFFNAIKSFVKSLVGSDAQMNRYALAINKNIDDIQDAWAKALALALERQQILNGESNTDVGVQIDDNTDTAAFSIRTTLLETYQDLKFKSYDKAVEYTAISIANQLTEKDMAITKDNYKKAFKLMESDAEYKEMYEKALNWVKSEESIATFIAKDDNKDFLDYIPDERYQAIKQNSDYAQGTFDLSNLCRKRELFTLIFDNLQIANPDILFTAEDIALIRDVMVNAKEEVACALCYVEDRRQLMGEIADTFINMYKDALKSKNKVIIKTTSEGEKKPLSVTKEQSEKYGYDYKSSYKATDSYIPNQADLITYKGFKNLTKEHPTIAHAFENYNNSRGMQAGRLVEGHAEYKREVLNYTKSQVESKNNKGGLRIFSFSDLEGIHVIDLMQLLIDCASKGVYAQAYTKVPAFARIVKDTGVKLNRSLIPANKDSKNAYAFIDGKWTKVVGKIKEDGIATVNGKEYLAVDTVEGIDVTSKDFINDPSNPNIGNIIIGISDKQIKLALDDPNIDYVIPFHTGQSEKILHIKGIDVWDNYKDIQEDKGDGEKINIYTDVIDKYNVTNKKEFVDSFKEECAKRGLTPRFDKFKGEDGYYKLLLDYKLFDENGNILPQGKITPAFDTETLEYIKSFLLADKERSKNLKLSDETMNKIYEEFDKMGKHLNPVGEETRQRYSIREDSEGNKLTEDQAKFFKDSKVVDENGNLKVMYHGTYNGGFTVFDPLKSDDDISLFFSDNETVSKSYADTFARRFNVYEEKPEKITNAKDAKDYLETKGFANIDSYTDKAYGKTNTYWSITTPEGRRLYGLTNSDFIKYAEEIRNTKKGVYAVYLNVTNPLTIDAEGRRWNNLTGYGNISRYPAWYIGSLTVFCHDDGVYQLRPKNLSISKGEYSIADIEEKFGDEFADIIYKIPIGEDAIFDNLAVNYDVKKVKPNGTRTAAIMAKLGGKDGVIFNNLIDNGGGWGVSKEASVPSTIAVVFNSNQVKDIKNEHPTSNEDIRYSIREDDQTITSEGTSLNQTPSTFTNYKFDSSDRILDYGGGRYDTSKRALEETYPGITVEVVDPFNRTEAHNQRILNEFSQNKADVITINNVLNVINSKSAIENVISESKKYLKENGMAYFAIYEGDGSGEGKETSAGYQNNQKAAFYVPMVEKYYNNVVRQGSFILASDGKINAQKIDSDTKSLLAENTKTFKAQKLDMKNSQYSIREDSDGNKLTEEQAEFFKDSKIVDKNGNLKVEYHGTNSDFFVFDTNNFGGVNGKAEGYGIYFTDDQEITSVYGGRQLKGYVNITKPAYSTKKTIKSTDLVKLIKTLCENEAKQFVESGDYDSVADAIKDTWVSNYEYTYDKSMNEVYKLVADSILRLNSSDMDIIQEVMNGTSIYSYKEANEFYSVLKDTLGFDGFVTYWTPADGSKKSEIVVAFDSNQFKLAENIAPTESNDIRYSVREDNEGNILSPGQQNYFKDSKAVDEKGNLLAMYHGTESDTFDTFKANEFIREANGVSKIVGYFSTNPEYSQAFGNITKYYLNVLNPLDFREFDGNGSLDSYIKWFEKKGIKNVKFDTAIEQEKLKGGKFVDENGKEYTSYYPHELIDYTYYWNGDGNLTEAIEAAGYDALLWLEGFEDEDLAYMPFNANAIKRADNLDPTNDERTQFSIRETDPNLVTEDRKEKIKTLKEDIALLKERANLDKQESKGQFWKPETLDAVAKYVIDETKTTVARKELREDLSALYNTIAHYVNLKNPVPNSSEAFERIMNNCYKLATKIYEASPMKVKVDANVDPSAKQTIGKIKEQDAIQDLAIKIYNKYWSVKRLETVADKYQKKVDALEKEHKKNMTIMLKKQGLADEIFYKDIINKVKKEAAEEKANYKEKNKRKAEAQKEANERRAEIEKITDQAKTLSKWLFQNSKNHPIPDPLKTPLLKMLAAIDPSSKQLLGLNNNSEKAFTPTKKDESMSLILGEVAEALKNINQEVSDSEKQDGNKESGLGFLDVPQYMIAKLDKIAKDMHRLEYKYDTLGKKVLELMDLESLQELRNDISMIKTAISTVNYAISQGNKIRVNYVAQYIIQYLKDLGQAKRDSLGNLARPIDFLTLDNTTPYYFFKHLGEGGEIVFKILADGMDKMTDRVEQISDFTEGLYTEEEQKKWRNNIREFELTQKLTETEKAEGKSNKVKVKLTDAQIMSLYCLAKREINGEYQGRDHMLRDGITIGQIDGKKKVGRQDTVTITQSQLDKITDIVENDKRMKGVADGLVKFMSTTLADWGNEVTWARWGIKQFVEDHYFPIAVNKETTKTDNLEKSSSLFALLNQDFTKPLQKEVRNEIMVYDIFDVFTKHASDMARYSSLGLPILDTIKVWNYSESEMKGDVNEERNKKNAAKESGERYDEQRKVDSVKKSIAKAFGEKGGNRYISNLLKNLNGQADKGVYDNIGMGMMKRYKASKIAASTMTALVQPLSYLRAGYVMNPKYMLEALTKAPQVEKMFNSVPVAKWKRMSLGVDTNIGRGVDRIINHQNTFGDKIVDKSLWLAEKMDELTWGYLYNACEAEIKATRKDLKPGTKEFDQAVADRAREVIYSTQIFDSTLTRSSFMRDKGYHAQMLSAFMSEPTLSYNMLLDSVTQYYQDAKKNGSAHAFKNKGKVVAKAISVYTLSAVVESVIREAFTRLRDYQDDDTEFFEDFWKDVIDRLKDELNILNKIPYAKQLMDAIEAFGKAYQNNNKMDEAFIQDIGKSIKAIDKAIESEEISYNTVYTVLNALADVTGLPFGNALREVKMIWNNTIGRVTGKYIQK